MSDELVPGGSKLRVRLEIQNENGETFIYKLPSLADAHLTLDRMPERDDLVWSSTGPNQAAERLSICIEGYPIEPWFVTKKTGELT